MNAGRRAPYSRGLRYLAEAGYAPDAMASFFEELASMRQGGSSAVERFFATHPDPGERAAHLRQLADTRGYDQGREALVGGFDSIRARVSSAPTS